MHKRKIAVVVTHRAPYGRLRPVLRAIVAHPDLELQLIVGIPMNMRRMFFALRHSDFASLREALPWFVRARIKTMFRRGDPSGHEMLTRLIKGDGFEVARHVPMFLGGGGLSVMLKIQGSVLFELPKILQELQPDVVLVHADRFEMLPVALTASTLNIPVAHTQGGDKSGTIDEVIRHAITKLSHLHFPTTAKSRDRIVQMGEDPKFVFMTGCPTVDILHEINLDPTGIYERNGKGYGDEINFNDPFLLVLQHPVTTEYDQSLSNMQETLTAVKKIGMPTLLFWPNIDGGADGATRAVRAFLREHTLPALSVYKNFNSDDFYRALNACAVAVGNSSSFIREGSYLGTPAILVGTRQRERERGGNVLEVGYSALEIEAAIRKQLEHGKYSQSNLYGDGKASERIAQTLAEVPLPSTQKTFHELPIA